MGTPNNGINGTLGTGLIAHWSFDNGSLLDESGNNRHLAQATAKLVKFSSDKDGNANSCALIDLIHSWLETPFSENVASPTISCWVKTNGNYGALVFIRGSGNFSEGFGIQYWSTGYFSIQTAVSGTGEITSGNIAGNNNWQHVVATYDKINGLLKIYVDKVLALIKSVSTTGITYHFEDNINNIKIGYNNYENFKGYLDEIRIYDRVLSDGGLTTLGQTATGEVAELYDMGVNYTATTKCDTPTFSKAGGSYQEPFTVSISTTTADADIYYTTDGSDPDETKTLYTTPIEITENTILKAIAYATGYDPSDILTVEYIIDGSIPEPVINVESGTYIGSVTIEMSTEEGDIYYTLNGSDPDESDMLYENPITISRSVVLKAVSISNGASSEILTRIYYIKGEDIGMEENQSSGLIVIGWTPEGDTKETILGEVPADGQEILSIQETINYFKTKYAGEYPTEGRVVAGAATFTVDLIESPTLRGLLSNTSVVSGTKTIIGLNSGAKAKTGKLRLHPMYAGADKSEDITILRAAPAVTDERTYSADGKKLMKVVFTVMGVKTALGTPAATDFTAHVNSGGIKVKMVNANDLGVSIASAVADTINDGTNVVTFKPGIGANRAIFFKSLDNFATAANTSYYEPTVDEIKAGSFKPDDVTWKTLTALSEIPTEATGYYYKAIEIGV